MELVNFRILSVLFVGQRKQFRTVQFWPVTHKSASTLPTSRKHTAAPALTDFMVALVSIVPLTARRAKVNTPARAPS
jgi:hypothetical protein